jgi:TolA-binding protein
MSCVVLAGALLFGTNLPAQNGSGGDLFFFQNSEYDIEKAIQTSEELLNSQPDNEFAASLMFQLVELYFRRSSDNLQSKMAAYEESLQKFEDGKLKIEPVIPRVSYRNAIAMGYRILDEYPTAPFVDKIIYRLAICHLLEGNGEQAIAYFLRLTNEYKTSNYIDEANFRIGEQYFDQHKYNEAIKYYNRLLNSWDSPFFDMALYKLAWSYYNIDNHTKAISTFIFLIDDLSQVEKANVEADGVSNADLRQEAVSYVAESFAEHGGAQAAEKFLLDMGEKEYSKTIFIRLGEIYQERNFYDESNETYHVILRLWPLHHTAPEVQTKIIKNLILTERYDQAEKQREQLVATYGPGSQWLAKHPEGEGREKALKLVEENLYILGTEAQKRGMETKAKKDLNLAIARYQEFVDKFPDSERAPQVQFYQGEAYYEMGDYINAANAYENVVVSYDKSEFASTAAYNRVLSSFKLLENSSGSVLDSVTYYIEDFLGNGTTHPIKVPGQLYGEMLQACNDFAKYLPDDRKAPEVLMKYGEALFNLGQFDLARDAYTMVVNRGFETQFTVQAYNMIAQSAFQLGDYITADKWYQKIAAEYPDSIKYVEKAKTMMASARFKLAEGLKEAGKSEIAAMAFQNIAASTDNPEIAERSILQAATQFEEAGNLVKAIVLYENFRIKVPNSSKIDEVLYKAATLSEKLPDYNRAAQNYIEIIRLRPNSVYASRALFNAAVALENSRNPENAIAIYERYARSYNDDADRHLEALVKVGEFAYRKQNFLKARQFFGKAINAYKNFTRSGKMADAYLPAQAQFMLTEMLFLEYQRVNIGKNFKADFARKQKLLNEITLSCKNTIQYKIADWTAGALYLMGATWEEIARTMYEAPRPQELQGDELQQYEKKLLQSLKPFKEKAIQQYRANLILAEKTNLENEWVSRSRVRAEQLTIELGLANTTGSNAANLNAQGNATNH